MTRLSQEDVRRLHKEFVRAAKTLNGDEMYWQTEADSRQAFRDVAQAIRIGRLEAIIEVPPDMVVTMAGEFRNATWQRTPGEQPAAPYRVGVTFISTPAPVCGLNGLREFAEGLRHAGMGYVVPGGIQEEAAAGMVPAADQIERHGLAHNVVVRNSQIGTLYANALDEAGTALQNRPGAAQTIHRAHTDKWREAESHAFSARMFGTALWLTEAQAPELQRISHLAEDLHHESSTTRDSLWHRLEHGLQSSKDLRARADEILRRAAGLDRPPARRPSTNAAAVPVANRTRDIEID